MGLRRYAVDVLPERDPEVLYPGRVSTATAVRLKEVSHGTSATEEDRR